MLTLLFIILLLLLATFAYAGLKGAPWVPTKANDVQRFIALADIQPNQTMVDLGCGDGRLLVAAADANTNVQAIGYELSLFPYLLAHARRLFSSNRKNIHIHYGNALTKNLHDADIVYSFLMPKIHTKLKEKFTKELKPGAKMITYVWPIEGLEPSKISTLEKNFKIYLYER